MSRFLIPFIAIFSFINAAHADDMIIFLHNAFYETNKEGQAHPQYGPYDFDGIVKALSEGGKVTALERQGNVPADQAAIRVINTIKAAMLRGVKPNKIKVIGASKGAYIAMIANQNTPNKNVRWVFVGGCFANMDPNSFQLNGKVLSIYETSDQVAGACPKSAPMFQSVSAFEEVALLTNLDHGFQFKPDAAWIKPAVKW